MEPGHLRITLLLAATSLLLQGCSYIAWKPENCGSLYGVARLGVIGDAYESGRPVQNIDGVIHTTFGLKERYFIDRSTLDLRTRTGDIVAFRVDRGALDKYGGMDWGERAYDVRPCRLARSAARRLLSRSEYDRYEREGRFD